MIEVESVEIVIYHCSKKVVIKNSKRACNTSAKVNNEALSEVKNTFLSIVIVENIVR